jgi:hypothetical protein
MKMTRRLCGLRIRIAELILVLVRGKLCRREYPTVQSFADDLRLMVMNGLQRAHADTTLRQQAIRLSNLVIELLHELPRPLFTVIADSLAAWKSAITMNSVTVS